MNLLHFAASAVLTTLPAFAQVILTESYSFPVGAPAGNIADHGVSTTFSQTISGSQIAALTEVQVGLHLSGTMAGGGWAGDLFVSLNRNLGDQTAVLLNQPGVTAGNPAGAGHDGWNVVFADHAANGDVHLGLPGGVDTILTGVWQPDGRIDPAAGARPALLSVFNGLGADGIWHLNLADLSPGGEMTLRSWNLTFTGTAITPVPEPAACAVLTALILGSWTIVRRIRR